jgi:transglutaminase-like putative cysteine protease
MAIHKLAGLQAATQATPRSSSGRVYTLTGIPDGVEGTRATLSFMVKYVKEYRVHPRIVELARSIVSDLPGKAFRQEAARLQNWVRENIRYTLDVYDVETLQTPLVTLDLKQGDCDDQSILLATLLNAIGHEARFVAVGLDRAMPDNFEHVFVETKIGGEWLPAETTEPVRLGEYPYSPEEVVTRMNYNV